jgi:hypothetical protein
MPLAVRRFLIFIGSVFLFGCGSTFIFGTSAALAACATSLTVNLTVELSPELAPKGQDVLIELRQGVVGHSKVVNSQKFHGTTGTVSFANLCAGSYFMDIGNGNAVAVTPEHQFADNFHYQSTIKVTFANGNVATKKRDEL